METVCSYCGVGCKFEVREGGKLRGLKSYPTNHGGSCAKGISLSDTLDVNRLTTPLMRETTEDAFDSTRYDDAIARIAQAIQLTTPDRVALYLSGQMLNEDYYVANKLAKGFIGTPHCDTNSRTCMASAVVGYKKTLGVDYVPVRMEDIDQANLLILIGANPAEAHVVLMQRIKKARKRGLRVVVIDPRYTATAKEADLYLPIRPGRDIDLLNALMRRLITEGLHDGDYITQYTEGFETLHDGLLALDEATLLDSAGITTEDFEKLVALWRENDRIITGWTMGLNQALQGTENNLAVITLHLLTGQINRPGCGPLSLTGQPNAMGGREVGGLATTLAVHLDYTEANRSKVAEFWQTDRLPAAGGLTAYEMLQAAHRGELDVLIVCHTDPVYHLPDRRFVEEAIARVPLVVEINAYEGSETAPYAHIRLPAAPFGYKEGTQTNLDRTLTHVEAFEAKGDLLQDWEIFAQIGQALGHENAFGYADTRAVFEEYQAMTRLSEREHLDIFNADYEALKTEPFVWGEDALESNRFFTPSGRAQLHFVTTSPHPEEPDEDYPFLLLTGRTRDQWHSGSKTAQLDKLQRHKPLRFVEIHPDDAARLGITEGQSITIRSRYGTLTTKARFADLRPGTLFIPVSDRRVNYLTSGRIDPQSKEPDYNHTTVWVEVDG